MSDERKLVTSKYVLSGFGGGRMTPPQVLKDGAVIVENNKIVEIGSKDKFSTSEFDEVTHFPHHVIMPGLVNTHSHAAMTLFRGFADDLTLFDWLSNHIWPAEAKMTADDVKIGAELAAVEALMSGTTTFNSMYWHPSKEIESFNKIGVRLVCGPNILTGIAKLDLEKTRNLISKYHGANKDMTRIGLYPHAPYTVNSEDYLKITEYVTSYNDSERSTPHLTVHTHLHEASSEMDQIRDFAKREGFTISDDIQTPTQYLDQIGVLHDRLYVAHAVGMNDNDISLLKDNGVGVAINSVSNMKLANKFAPVTKYYDMGVKIGLATDSATSNNNLDMFEEVKTTALVQKGYYGDPTRPRAFEVLKMATAYGARAMGWEGVGDISVGSYADMIAIDLKKPHLMPISSSDSLVSHLVYSAQGSDVDSSMVNGEWRMKGRKLFSVDLDELFSRFENAAINLLNRASQ